MRSALPLHLDDVALFARVAELGTLSAAARERNAPVSQVTRALVRLETACGARLLHRSTHGLSLTDEGDMVLAHGRRLLDIAAEVHADLTGKISGPSGWVRLSVSPILAHAVIAPSLNALYERHPGLHVDIAADDRMVDMAREGVDVAIRTGSPQSQTLVARQIGTLTRALYASPAYLARFGVPRDTEDLRSHRLIANSSIPALNRWALGTPRPAASRQAPRGGQGNLGAARRFLESDGKHTAEFVVEGHTRTDNTVTTLALVEQGVGIARVIDLAARPLVRRGVLVPVLPGQFATPPVPMFAVMLQERHRLPKIRACIDHWQQWMQGLDDDAPQAEPGRKVSHA